MVDAAIVVPAACIRIAVFHSPAIRQPLSGLGDVFLLALFAMMSFAVCRAQPDPGETSSRGAQIFSERCAQCHGEHGEGRSAIITIAGPNIQAEHDYGKVMTAVEVGPSHMPSFAYVLPVEDIRVVSHFVVDKIANIPLGPGDIAEGGKLFQTHCASCHRTAARGGAMGFAGVNAPELTDKSDAIVAGAVRWGPGPMPSFATSVLNDNELSSLVAYVRYVQSPASPGGSPLRWYGPVAEGFTAWIIVFGLVAVAIWIEKGGRG